MSNKQEPAYITAAKLLAVAYYRCYISYEQPKIRLDNREKQSVIGDNKKAETRALKEKNHD